MVHRLWQALFSYGRCLHCGQAERQVELENGLCPTCQRVLTLFEGLACAKCGLLLPEHCGDSVFLCPGCLLAPPPWSALAFCNFFTGPLRKAIIAFKYKGDFSKLLILQELMVRAFERHFAPWVPDLILPVPITKKRIMERGFNQSVELGRILARRLGAPLGKNVLTRVKDALPQMGLHLRERLQNVKGTVQVDCERVAGRTVLLIDDVYTSGATLRECAAVLCRSKVKEIKVLVVARTQLG